MQPEYRSSRCVLYRGNGGAIDDERLGNDGAVCGRYPAAAAVHGIAGFGFAQVSMGIMPLFRSPSSASIIFTATAVVANARVWWSVRDASDWEKVDRSCRWGLVVGMPLGIVVFSGFDAAQMRVAIGAVLVLAVIVVGATQQLDVVTDWIEEKDYRPGIIGATAGLLAGILGGAVAVPGPPMIVYGPSCRRADSGPTRR